MTNQKVEPYHHGSYCYDQARFQEFCDAMVDGCFGGIHSADMGRYLASISHISAALGPQVPAFRLTWAAAAAGSRWPCYMRWPPPLTQRRPCGSRSCMCCARTTATPSFTVGPFR